MSKIILIIDDEEIIRRALQRAFEKKSYQVLLAENGRQGLELFARYKPDLIILDLMMPVMSGSEMLNELANTEHPPIIVMSAFTGGLDLAKLIQMGATSFIAKPFENIFNIVEQVEAYLK